VRAVVEADADDLVRVGDWGEQLRSLDRIATGGVGALAQLIEAAGREQVAEADPVDAEELTGVEHASVLEDAGPRFRARPVAHEPHRGHPSGCSPATASRWRVR
jgi:hypothetical protein